MGVDKSAGVPFKYFDIAMAAFVVIIVLSNIASSAKFVDTGLSFFGIDLYFDGGTLLFPFAYVLGDVLTEVYGFRASRRAIWTGFVILAFSALFLFVLRILPGYAGWEAWAGYADGTWTGSDSFDAMFGGMIGLVLASLSGYLVGGFSNAVLVSRIKVLMKGRMFWTRAMASTLAGQLLDSLVFVTVATLLGVFRWEAFLSLVLTNYILKCVLEAAALPGTCALVRFLKKREGVDVYDVGVKYKPWG